MRREVQRRVRELSEEKEAVEARLVLESDRRLELQDENAELQQEVCGGASSVSPARSSDDGNTATASSSETAEGDGGSGSGSGSERRAKRRRKKKKRQEMRLQRRRGHLPDDDAEEEECGRLRAISSEYFD